MITIDFNSFWFEQDELKESCIEFIQNIIGTAKAIIEIKELSLMRILLILSYI